jgi:hypothetical protein
VLPVQIQVQQQAINPDSNGTVPVAVLSGTYEGVVFDATTIVRSSLNFAGATARESSGKSTPDLNKDRKPDMLFHFEAGELSLTPGGEAGLLTGVTESNIYFEAYGALQLVPPEQPVQPEKPGKPGKP